MPAPTKLGIAMSSVKRLINEENSYRKEQAQQEERIKKLEKDVGSDENAEYMLKQEVVICSVTLFWSLF
jgi:tubulin binding cofactor A